MISIRQAGAQDFDLVADFIRKLADYEKLAHEVRFDDAVLEAFGRERVQARLARVL